MAKFDDKISHLIESQLPDFVLSDHPKFVEFIKTYYAFMESAEITISDVQGTDGILLETETNQINNLVLDAGSITGESTQKDTGDKIILEDTVYGKFTIGEIIKGNTSNATAKVLAVDYDNNRLFISAQDKFQANEIIVGQSSNANAKLTDYKPNPVQTIQELTSFRDPDKVISNFLTQFRDEFLATIPENLATGIDKRKLIKNIRSMYRMKGTSKGHELFFRLLFGEQSETIYPREQILKASDGQWDTQKIIRCIAVSGNTQDLIGRQIRGDDSKATAIIENVFKFQIGQYEISELIVNEDTIQGTFQVGEVILGTKSDTDDYFIKANITGIPGQKTLLNDGNLYDIGDNVTITGGGTGALFSITGTGKGKIDEIIIDNVGQGYSTGDALVFDNSETVGQGAAGFVAVVNGGFAPESGTPGMSTDDHIIMEDETQNGDVYFGNKLVQEENGNGNVGDITDVFLTNKGLNYDKLPAVTINSSGTGGILKAYGTEVGKITEVTTVELGLRHELSPTPPTLNFQNNIIFVSQTGNFIPGDSVSFTGGASGTIVSVNNTLGLMKLKNVSGTIQADQNFTGTLGGSATVKKIDLASATINVVSVGDTDGKFINEDGHVSESTMKIQDSLYYQDFSYVLKVGRSINEWRDSFKKTMHASGFYYTGQVALQNRLNLRLKDPIEGISSGLDKGPLFQLFNTLFSTILGRRLGTNSDGTTLRPNPLLAGSIDNNPNTTEHFPNNTRDITLTMAPLGFKFISRRRGVIANRRVTQGFAYAGPRWGTLNKYHNTVFVRDGNKSGYTFATLGDLRIIGTNTDLDGTKGIFTMMSGDGLDIKCNITFPSVVQFSGDTFDNTVTNFSSDQRTFDDTTA